MAKLVVNMNNVSDVFKNKIEKAKKAMNQFDFVVPTDLDKFFELTAKAHSEGKKRITELSHKLSHYPFFEILLNQAKTVLTDMDEQGEKVLHLLGIPTMKDFNKLSKKVDRLVHSKSDLRERRPFPM